MTKGRAWAIALAAGATVLVLVAVFGDTTIAVQFGKWAGNNALATSVVLWLTFPRWNLTPPDPHTYDIHGTPGYVLAGEWVIVVLVIVLTLLFVRGLVRSLEYNRSGFTAFIGSWGATGIAGGIAAAAGGAVELYGLNGNLDTGQYLTQNLFSYASHGAFYGLFIGWLVGLVALAAAKAALDPTRADGLGFVPPLPGPGGAYPGVGGPPPQGSFPVGPPPGPRDTPLQPPAPDFGIPPEAREPVEPEPRAPGPFGAGPAGPLPPPNSPYGQGPPSAPYGNVGPFGN